MEYILSTLTTALLFLLLILLLAAKPEISKKITTGALAIAGIFGLLIYGYGYLMVTDNFLLAILKALPAVCGSFVGTNEYAAISSVPVMQTLWMQILCSLVRVCALYATASAVITSLGAEAMKKLRLWAARRSKLHLIYGADADTLSFGKDLLSRKERAVVYIGDPATSVATAISRAGLVLRSDAHALNADAHFLRNVGHRRGRKLTLYALSKNTSDNIRYAQRLLATLEARGAAPENLRLVILGQEDLIPPQLQAAPDRYGYGFVSVVSGPAITARLLTVKYPPCDTLSFDEAGKATEDFEALLVGFGQVGRAVLKNLVMNGQFEGSRFHATVFSPDCGSTDGSFYDQLHLLYEKYDIHFHENDARSRRMYAFLKERARHLKYVAVCVGSEARNREISEELTAYFRNAGLSVPVYACSHSGVESFRPDGTSVTHKLYCSEILCDDALDAKAMLLNHRYQSAPDKTPMQTWMECDPFSRQSSRASADFMPAMLRAAGRTPAQATKNWNLTEQQLENLSRTEHLRWCAFHYCMGFLPMEEAEFQSRAALYREGKAIRIGKNLPGRTHACLVDWEELDSLSEKEAAVTGRFVDYKALDTANVLAIPELLELTKQ